MQLKNGMEKSDLKEQTFFKGLMLIIYKTKSTILVENERRYSFLPFFLHILISEADVDF